MNFSNEENGSAVIPGSGQETNDNSVLGVIYLVLSVLVMAANGVVVIIVVVTQELHLPTLWVITNMAVWDFLYGLFHLVFVVPSAFLNRFAYSDGLIGTVSLLQGSLACQNLLNTAFMVVDRYIAVRWPLKYPNMSTKKNYLIAGVVTFIISVLRLLCMVIPNSEYYYQKDTAVCVPEFESFIPTIASIIFFFPSFLVIFVCSAKMVLEMMRSRRQVRPEGPRLDSVSKISLMVTISAGIYCFSYVPACAAIMLTFVYGKENIPPLVLVFSCVSAVANSLWNVFIYTATYMPFREALISTFCKSYYRRRRQAEIQQTFR